MALIQKYIYFLIIIKTIHFVIVLTRLHSVDIKLDSAWLRMIIQRKNLYCDMDVIRYYNMIVR